MGQRNDGHIHFSRGGGRIAAGACPAAFCVARPVRITHNDLFAYGAILVRKLWPFVYAHTSDSRLGACAWHTLGQGAPIPWPENVEIVVGTLKDVRRVPVMDDDDDDGECGSGGRGRGRGAKRKTSERGKGNSEASVATRGGTSCSEGGPDESDVTDLTLDDSEDGESNFYEEGHSFMRTGSSEAAVDDCSDSAARAMAVRIAASLGGAPASASGRFPCALCGNPMADDPLVSSCIHCRTHFHATCLASAMLKDARAPTERLLPFGALDDGLPFPDWTCVKCGGALGWREAMEAGLQQRRRDHRGGGCVGGRKRRR